MIEYRKGNLFDAPPGVALVQACNCQGSWGSGVAAEFRNNFKYAFLQYQKHCRKHLPKAFRARSILVGSSHSVWDHKKNNMKEPYLICSLFTSDKYASFVDSNDMIVAATDKAIAHLLKDPALTKVPEIHSPKMNSGLFHVPWELTASIIEKHLEALGKPWIVWEL